MSKTLKEFLDEQTQKESEGTITLSESDIVEFQNRWKHYLNAFEIENKMNASEVAKKLGYTPVHYSRLKLIGSFNKVASCLLFLSNFASLKKLSLSEFMINIENKPLKSVDGQISRRLWDWELDLLEFFSKIQPTIRRFFTRKIIKDTKNKNFTDENTKLEILLALIMIMQNFNHADFKFIVTFVKDFANRTSVNNDTGNDSSSKELLDIRNDLIRFMKSKINETEMSPE
jgi:hypothetical protein